MNTSVILKTLITYRYFALFPAALLEGPVVALIVGFMVHMGYFTFLYAFIILILGDFLPDSIYYAIGRFGNKKKLIAKYDTKSKIISGHMHFLENAWKKHTIKTMFVSKLAYGLSTPLLVTSGLVRLPYVRFVRWALLVTIFQYGLLMTIGYYLGRSYDSAIGYVHYAEIIVAAFAVLFIIGFFAIQKYARRKVEQMEHSDII